MNILVTGSAGFVGKNLVESLKNIRDNKDKTRPGIHIKEVFEYDMKVEKSSGGQEYDLDKEKNKVAQSFVKVGGKTKKPVVVGANPQKRKENPTKASIIAEIAKFLEENSENACENVTITNKERQIAFSIGENNYEFTLVQKRAKKS